MTQVLDKVQALIEALPYMQKFKGKTVVIKYGGNAMVSEYLKNKVIQDIIFMQCVGLRVVVVHGGGPEITAMLKQLGKETKFVNGSRVTDEETVGIAEMVLVGKTNPSIVSMMNRMGAKAVGLNGKDASLIMAKKHYAQVQENGETKLVDIGFVGDVVKVNTDFINVLLDNQYIPVIAPIGTDEQGQTYNINADYVAGEIAGALKAEKLLLITDVEGIYQDYHDKSTFISTLTFEQAQKMIEAKSIDGGMIPKVEACITALSQGTVKTHIIDGRKTHSLLLEVFTDKGIGTEVIKE